MNSLALALTLIGSTQAEEPVTPKPVPPQVEQEPFLCPDDSCFVRPYVAAGIGVHGINSYDLSPSLRTRVGVDITKPDSERPLSASFQLGLQLDSPQLDNGLTEEWADFSFYTPQVATALAVEYAETFGARWTVIDLAIPFDSVFSTRFGMGLELSFDESHRVWFYGRAHLDHWLDLNYPNGVPGASVGLRYVLKKTPSP